MSSRPSLSVVVTAYRRKAYLGEAVRSVLAQDLDRSAFELLVLKDFEDDELDAWLAREAPTVRVHTEDIPLVGSLMAKGVDLAQGDVVCFLDDDDRFRPGKLAGVRDQFGADPDLGFLRNSYVPVDAAGNRLAQWRGPSPQAAESFDFFPAREDLAGLRRARRYGAYGLSNMSIRADCLRPWLPYLREIPAATDSFLFFLAMMSTRRMRVEASLWNDYRFHRSATKSLLEDEGVRRYLEHQARVTQTTEVMRKAARDHPGRESARRFAESVRAEAEATAFLLDPSRPSSLRQWIGYARAWSWRREPYLALYGALALYKALSPARAARRFQEWQAQVIRSAGGTPPVSRG